MDICSIVYELADAEPGPEPTKQAEENREDVQMGEDSDEVQQRRARLKRSLNSLFEDSPMLDDSSNDSCKRRRMSDSEEDSDSDSPSGGIRLSAEQQELVDLALAGASFYFGGHAGTGKSVAMRAVYDALRNKYSTEEPEECPVHLTATTGKVAGDLAARTVHNFMAIGKGDGPVKALVQKIKRAKKQYEVIRHTRVLMIDEISMMSAEMMDKLSEVLNIIMAAPETLRRGRRNKKLAEPVADTRTFGGIQMIVCGDFHQLPPVSKKGEAKASLCIKSKAWNNTFATTRLLTKVFRQACDPQYARVVDEVREGFLSAHSRQLLATRLRHGRDPIPDENGVIPTVFFPHRKPTSDMNNLHLRRLPGETHFFQGLDKIFATQEEGRYGIDRLRNELENICRAPKDLWLKQDAQVVLIKNIDQKQRLCNGLRGVVVGFQEHDDESKRYPIVRFQNGITRIITPESWKIEEGYRIMATRTQIPLMLGWASTVHGGQGETCSLCALNISGCFERGMAYVQFSRATSLNGMSLDRVPTDSELTPNPEAADFWRRIVQAHIDRTTGQGNRPVHGVAQKRTGTMNDFFAQDGMSRSNSFVKPRKDALV